MIRSAPLALVLAGLVAGFGHAAMSTEVPPACHTVEVGDHLPITASDIDALISKGYTGRTGDGAERLYGPGCDMGTPSHGWCVTYFEGEIEAPRPDYAAWCDTHQQQ